MRAEEKITDLLIEAGLVSKDLVDVLSVDQIIEILKSELF